MDPNLLSIIGAICAASSGIGLWAAHRNQHMAKEITKAPLVDMTDPNFIVSLQKSESRFVKLQGAASTGPHEPLRVDGIDKNLAFYRKIVVGRHSVAPWTPILAVHFRTTYQEERLVSRSDLRPLAWGISTTPTNFMEISSDLPIADEDLVILRQREYPAGDRRLSAVLALIKVPYPYAHIVQDATLPVGSRLTAYGKVALSKETGTFVFLPAEKIDVVSPWPTPRLVTTKNQEDLVARLDSSAFNYQLISGGLLALGFACVIGGQVSKSRRDRD